MIWLILCLAMLGFGVGAILGAPYLPILRRDSERLLAMAQLKPGSTLIDLGCGDGRMLKLAAKQGIRSIGYEINPLLYVVSLIVTWPERRLVTIHLGNYWNARLPKAETIYVFLLDRYMPKLATKLAKECDPDVHLISYIFEIPGAKAIQASNNTFVYRVGDLVESPTKS